MNGGITNLFNYGNIYFISTPFKEFQGYNDSITSTTTSFDSLNNKNINTQEKCYEKQKIIQEENSNTIIQKESKDELEIKKETKEIQKEKSINKRKGIDMKNIENEKYFIRIPIIEKSFFHKFYEPLKEWTSKQTFKLIYDSNSDGLTACSFNTLLKGKENILLMAFTKKGYVFGSFHSIIPNDKSMISNDLNHFLFSLSSPYLIEPTKFIGNGILHLHDDSEDNNVVDIFSGYSIYSNNTVMVYSSFDSTYNSNSLNLVGKSNSKVIITKFIAFECI
ncbi:hypothetical protein KM1_086340 [Entamoeba histolytica HM-3:IMSS]|uniref:TLDc domain-containing protein n=1 Tax=Entamoeba histolytica HM-3:IMSS TaxID=885315 RepID=M7W5H5_ENTHI|nr:hypothetical protein KM1_086340 [Entamoeba histolytica HM-3:IMSS]